MNKQDLISKWGYYFNDYFIADLNSVIDNEIAKVQEPQPELNPIEQAYERGEKIRQKDWSEGDWIQKYDEIKCISRNRLIQSFKLFSQKINTHPEKWELYTEPADQVTDQVIDQVQNAKPFDKDRFERMFRAVVASGEGNLWSSVFDITNQALKQLDAYYASKEGGNNG